MSDKISDAAHHWEVLLEVDIMRIRVGTDHEFGGDTIGIRIDCWDEEKEAWELQTEIYPDRNDAKIFLAKSLMNCMDKNEVFKTGGEDPLNSNAKWPNDRCESIYTFFRDSLKEPTTHRCFKQAGHTGRHHTTVTNGDGEEWGDAT